MDTETKHLLKQLCAVVRDSTEQAFYAHEMAERIHLACSHMVRGFQNCFDNPVRPDVQHIVDSKAEILRRLDGVIRLLEK